MTKNALTTTAVEGALKARTKAEEPKANET